MKVTPIETPVVVQSFETTGVTLALTKEEALYLFHLLGDITPYNAFKAIKTSIDNYYPNNKYLLDNINGTNVNKVLIDPIYDGIKKVLNMKMD